MEKTKNLDSNIPKNCLVAVDVRSAHNVGSLFRNCEGFGAELFLVGICPRPIQEGHNDDRLPHIAANAHKEIAKTALGAEEQVRWRYAQTLEECIETLKGEGFRVIALEQSDTSHSIYDLKPTKNTAVLVGREVEGLSEKELKLCDATYEIPMAGKKESFNVSVAAGIVLYQLGYGMISLKHQ